MNKIYYDFVDEPKTLSYKKLTNFSSSFENIIDKTKNRYIEKLRLKRLFFHYIRVQKSKLSSKLTRLHLKNQKKNNIFSSHLEDYTSTSMFLKKKSVFGVPPE